MAWNLLRNKKYSGEGYDFNRWFEPTNIFSGQKNDILANNETIFAAVSRLANSMGSLPLKLYRDRSPIKNRIADLMEIRLVLISLEHLRHYAIHMEMVMGSRCIMNNFKSKRYYCLIHHE